MRDSGIGSRDERVAEILAGLLDDSGTADIDAVCARHPDLSAQLRQAYSDWEFMRASSDDDWGAGDVKVAAAPRDAVDGLFVELLAEGRAEDRYQFRGELGRGGMGVVHEVYDPHIRRTIAMKTMGDNVRDSAVGPATGARRVSRFLDEVRITGQLDHPGIVPVHEVGVDRDGRAYFTMRLVRGATLADVRREMGDRVDGPGVARIVNIIIRVCEAVSFAHSKGVVHRDIKPENIMVGGFGEVYVMDWGIARDFGARAASHRRGSSDREMRVDGPLDRVDVAKAWPTQIGDVIGTPGYMAPEQLAGDPDQVGPRADVYAIGCMLHDTLVGATPAATVSGPSTRSAADLSGLSVPPDLAAICAKSMESDPSKRYASARDLGDDLRAFVEDRVVTAYERGLLAEARKWVRRNPGFAVAAAMLPLIVLAAAVLSAVQERRHSDEMRVERDDAIRAKAMSDEARRVADVERSKVLRLSDARLIEVLIDEASHLWPPRVAEIPRMEGWLARAEVIVNRMPAHGAMLDELRADPREGDTEASRAWWIDQLERLLRLFDQLAADDVHGDTIPGVRFRIETARRVDRVMAFHEDAWQEATRAIAEHPLYHGMRLSVQEGLVPLGADPSSGLWEFWDVLTGDRPERRPDGKLVIDDGTGMVYVLIPEGEFWMGSQLVEPGGRNYDPLSDAYETGPGYKPVYREVAPLLLSKYEMTQGQWERIEGSNPSYSPPGTMMYPRRQHSLRNPVESLNHDVANAVAIRIGARLPTETEWEYSARSGADEYMYPIDRDRLPRMANFADVSAHPKYGLPEAWESDLDLDDGYSGHAPVGTYDPNGFGMHDMLGNVYELCSDEFKASLWVEGWDEEMQELITRHGEAKELAVRGSSFGDNYVRTRVTRRTGSGPSSRGIMTGVRFARDIHGLE